MAAIQLSSIFTLPVILSIIAGLVLLYLGKSTLQWYHNWQGAKASGVPYIICPVWMFNPVWLLTERFLMPIIQFLPVGSWKMVVGGDWAWKGRYSIFERLKTDTFIVVSPEFNVMITADADVINKICIRRNDFPKPVKWYGMLDLYGKNIVTFESQEWKRHRKIMAPQFGESNNRLVFTESVFQAKEMVTSWLTFGKPLEVTSEAKKDISASNGHASTGSKIDTDSPKTVATLCGELTRDAMRLSLHVISRAGFGVRCLWPGIHDDKPSEGGKGAMRSGDIPAGHHMSYVESLETLLHGIIMNMLIPKGLLEKLPFNAAKKAATAFNEWGQYMSEIYDEKTKEITEDPRGKSNEGMDLMGAMIRGSGQIPNTPNHGKPDAGLTPTEVMGNAFVFFLAGHETAANIIHFAIVYLALRPGLQRKLQAELDAIFGARPADKWDYDADLPRLFDGLAGAVMNETLRLIPPVIGIPKSVSASRPQRLDVNGKDCLLPAGCTILLSAASVHRNPKYWPAGPPRSAAAGGPIHPLSNAGNDLEEFKPERWLPGFASLVPMRADPVAKHDTDAGGEDDLGVSAKADTASTMYAYPKGAYIPFSIGHRACIGRRFAQVEILATLAVVFRDYSVELDVSDLPGGAEAEIQAAEPEGRRQVWEKARATAEGKIRDEMGTVITIQLRGEGIKLRVCKRGREVFDYDD